MDFEDRKTVKVLKRLAKKVQAPDFSERFGVSIPKKHRQNYLKAWSWPIAIAAVCLIFSIGFLFGDGIFHKTSQPPSVEEPPIIDVPPIIDDDPPIQYYINTLTQKTVTASEADEFINSIETCNFIIHNKDESECFLYIQQEDIILGASYNFYLDSSGYSYICTLTILSEKVVDADSDYADLDSAFASKELDCWVMYKYAGFIESFHEYKASFKKDKYNYLIQYSSRYEDFEAGFSTIF